MAAASPWLGAYRVSRHGSRDQPPTDLHAGQGWHWTGGRGSALQRGLSSRRTADRSRGLFRTEKGSSVEPTLARRHSRRQRKTGSAWTGPSSHETKEATLEPARRCSRSARQGPGSQPGLIRQGFLCNWTSVSCLEPHICHLILVQESGKRMEHNHCLVKTKELPAALVSEKLLLAQSQGRGVRMTHIC